MSNNPKYTFVDLSKLTKDKTIKADSTIIINILNDALEDCYRHGIGDRSYASGFNSGLNKAKERILNMLSTANKSGAIIFNMTNAKANNTQKRQKAHWIPVKEEGFWLDDAATWSVTGKPTTKIQYKCSNCGKVQGTIVVDNDYKCCPYCTAIIER